MFTVHCPPSLLWHPSVHHSLLLLRALKQPHTLLLEPEKEPAVRLPIPLLCDQHMRIKVSAPQHNVSQLPCVYQPDHIPFLLPPAVMAYAETPEHGANHMLAPYLDSVTVAQHILHTWDALAVAFNTGEMEMTRRLHAALMDMVEQLEVSLEEDGNDTAAEEPLSTWPIFTTLEFLVEQAGLLTSAFPRLENSYRGLVANNRLVHQHRRLVRKTAAQLSSSSVPLESSTEVDMAPFAYPQRGLLLETQRRLSKYTTSVEETVSRGVSGEHGPLNKRMSGGGMGMQAAPARLPWTRQNTPLKR